MPIFSRSENTSSTKYFTMEEHLCPERLSNLGQDHYSVGWLFQILLDQQNRPNVRPNKNFIFRLSQFRKMFILFATFRWMWKFCFQVRAEQPRHSVIDELIKKLLGSIKINLYMLIICIVQSRMHTIFFFFFSVRPPGDDPWTLGSRISHGKWILNQLFASNWSKCQLELMILESWERSDCYAAVRTRRIVLRMEKYCNVNFDRWVISL